MTAWVQQGKYYTRSCSTSSQGAMYYSTHCTSKSCVHIMFWVEHPTILHDSGNEDHGAVSFGQSACCLPVQEEKKYNQEQQCHDLKDISTLSLDKLLPDRVTSDIIAVCPIDLCNDVILANLHKPLTSLIVWVEGLIHKHGTHNMLKFLKLSIEICHVLERFHARDEHIHWSNWWGWPINISWHNLPNCIMAIKNDILNCVYNPSTREGCVIQQYFLDQLEEAGLAWDYKLLVKGLAAPMSIYQGIRPG